MLIEKIKAYRFPILMYTAMVVIIFLSLQLNKQYSTAEDVLRNFMVPSMLLGLGLSYSELKKWSRTFLFVLGFIWFGYISLYYLIGFHNHHWGN